jgi:hypothetical protein
MHSKTLCIACGLARLVIVATNNSVQTNALYTSFMQTFNNYLSATKSTLFYLFDQLLYTISTRPIITTMDYLN